MWPQYNGDRSMTHKKRGPTIRWSVNPKLYDMLNSRKTIKNKKKVKEWIKTG